MKSKFTLIPSEFFSEQTAREILSKVVLLDAGEPLSFLELPACNSVLVYAGDRRPKAYDMVMSLFKIREHNKIIACHADGELSLVIAEGQLLRFCNSFEAEDFVTAQYYIFRTLKSLQLNPQLSTIYFMGAVPAEQTMSMYNYFKNVEVLI